MTVEDALSPTKRPWAYLGLGFGVLMVALVLILAAADALGPYNECLRSDEENCYCENVDKARVLEAIEAGRSISDRFIERQVLLTSGLVKQPVSTWSNLSSIVLGVILLWALGNGTQSSKNARFNPMSGPTPRAIGYGLVLVFMGPGSMFLHVSLTKYGGWGDNLSMNFFITYAILHNLFRWIKVDDDGWFFGVWSGVNVLLGVLVFPGLIEGAGIGKLIFGVLVGIAIVLELIISCSHWPVLSLLRGSTKHMDRPKGFMKLGDAGPRFTWFFAGLLFFGTAFLIWNLSGDQAPLCDPESALQGHGAWHILSYASVLCFYLHFRAENRPSPERS